jgi:hypothetical protein
MGPHDKSGGAGRHACDGCFVAGMSWDGPNAEDMAANNRSHATRKED